MPDYNINFNNDKLVNKTKQAMEQKMMTALVYLVAFVKDNLSTSSSISSSGEGDFPHSDSGMLRNSITYKLTRDGNDIVGIYGVMSGPATAYARRLELGFYGIDSLGRNYNQGPRPFLVPSYSLNRDKIKKIIGS